MKKMLFLLLGILGMSQPIRADIYDISQINVAADGPSAIEARTIALQDGQVMAFWRLMDRMLSPNDLDKIPSPHPDEITNWVQNVSIDTEKMTATRYMGTLSFRFKPTEINKLLIENNAPFLAEVPPKTLIIPVFQSATYRTTLDENSPVFRFLKEADLTNAIFDLAVPSGDETEHQFIKQVATSTNLSDWQWLLDNYKAKQLLFFSVEQSGPVVTVTSWFLPDGNGTNTVYRKQLMLPDGDIYSALPQLWEHTLSAHSTEWRTAHTNDLSKPLTYRVRVPVISLSEWESIRKKLEKAPFLDGFALRAFRPGQALITIEYKGTALQLQSELQQLGFELEDAGWNVWKLIILK